MNRENISDVPWYLDSIFYQIYPQTFRDSNGDGVGDLQGIREKLDYLQDLGIGAMWLNPIFQSPFHDAGYDIAGYYKIAPRYGNLADLKMLIKEAYRRGIRILLDLPIAQTSSHHRWFQKVQ